MLASKEIIFICILFFCLFLVIPIEYQNANVDPGPNSNQSLLRLPWSDGFPEDGAFNWTDIQDQKDSLLKDALERISKLHAPDGARYGITKFSLMSQDDFKKKFLTLKTNSGSLLKSRNRKRRALSTLNVTDIPVRFDWRDKGLVTAVKTQYTCGACWAFSAVGVLETMYAFKTGHLIDLSAQQVIDCAAGNLGCLGGDTCTAIRWMSMDNVLIHTESEYPLTLRTGFCKNKPSRIRVKVAKNFTCSNFVGKEEEILRLIANHGPVAVAVDGLTWQDYLGGVIRYNCESNLNHAAQIVGYDLSGPVPYYIVRNSWGPDFGIGGYLHIEIGKNLCGMAMQVSALDAEIIA